jgi:hypothetical protein
MKFFKSKLTLPIANKTIHVSQINNAEFIELQKCLFENDDEQISEFFEYLLTKHCSNDAVYMYNIDKFACLLKLRSISCGDTINFSMSNNEVQMSLSMINVIDKLNACKMCSPLTHKISSNMHAVIDCPSDIFISSSQNIHCSMIKQIYSTNSDAIDVFNLTASQRQMLFESINSDVYNTINEFIINSSQSVCIIPSNEALQINEIKISPFDDSLFEFAKFIFKDDLINTYKMMYALNSKAYIDIMFLNTIAPVEQQMYARFLIEDTEEQNNQLKKTTSNLNN